MRKRESFLILLMLGIKNVCAKDGTADTNPQDRIEELENRIDALEKMVRAMEPLFVKRYGLIRRCEVPVVEHGLAHCGDSKDIVMPGERCSLICNAGYIATPGRDSTTCQEGGHWSTNMQCEVPLVVIAGGQIGRGEDDLTVEVIDFEDRASCNIRIPDLPRRNESGRALHNLIYHPAKQEILACNGVSATHLAECDAWQMKFNNEPWRTRHSSVNKGSALDDAEDRVSKRRGFKFRQPNNPESGYGRYAAESMTLNGRPTVIGGMVHNSSTHWPTKTIRSYMGDHWSGKKEYIPRDKCHMTISRAFFCAVKLQETGIVSIGGFSYRNNIVNSVGVKYCNSKKFIGASSETRYNLAELPTPLSGHGCSQLPDSYDIIVSGGSRNKDDNSQSESESYLLSWANNTWQPVGNMKEHRFGHRIVTVGDKVLAIGGKQRSPEIHLNNIERFDPHTRKWISEEKTLKKPRAHFGIVLIPRSSFSYLCRK